MKKPECPARESRDEWSKWLLHSLDNRFGDGFYLPRAKGTSGTGQSSFRKIYEVDPLNCPRCYGATRVIALIEEQEAFRNQQAEKFAGTILDSKKKGLADLPLTHLNSGLLECRDTESNCGHADFQSAALPTELSRQGGRIIARGRGKSR